MYLDLLHDRIDITQVPFSDRGSRLLIFQEPDHNRLYLKLAERLISIDPALEAHVHRPPFVRDLCLLGPDGEALDFHLTTSPALLTFETGAGTFELAFQDETTLAFGLPASSTSGIRFTVRTDLYQSKGHNGWQHPVRIVSYATNGVFVKNKSTPTQQGESVEILVRGGPEAVLLLRIGEAVGTQNGVTPFSVIRSAAQRRWQDWFEQVPPVAEPYRQTYAYAWWTLANNLVSPQGYIQYEAAMPTKAKYIGLWLWDSALHAVALRHRDAELARDQIRAFLPHQLPDGMLPDAIFDEGAVTEISHPIRARVTKPPILAWAALKVHESAPSLEFLREIYLPLARWNAWWFDQSEQGRDGLAQYNHPYSSGLDDNPLWDAGMPVVSPDLNTYLCIQMKALGEIAAALGLDLEAERWQARSRRLVSLMVEKLWDQEAGYFQALHQGRPVPVLTPFNLYPLWTGELPAGIRDRLLEHLKDPQKFWGQPMLPTVARGDPKFSPGTMWRGPVWGNINYFFVEALSLIGFSGEASVLREATLDLIGNTHGIYEYYHAETGQPPATAAPMFGWSAAVFIDLAIQASSLKKVDK